MKPTRERKRGPPTSFCQQVPGTLMPFVLFLSCFCFRHSAEPFRFRALRHLPLWRRANSRKSRVSMPGRAL